MHCPGHIRSAFEEWVDEGMPEVAMLEVHYEPQEVPPRRLLGLLWHCTDIMPSILCTQLDVPAGTSYATAAHALMALED